MKITLTAALDLDAVRDAAIEAMRESLEIADPGSIGSIGADADSQYETVGWDVEHDGDGGFTITVEVERLSGKFAAKDEIREVLTDDMALALDCSVELGEHAEMGA